MTETTPWGTAVGPATTGGAYPRELWARDLPFGDGSAGAVLGPDPRLDVIEYPRVDRDHVEHCDVAIIGSGAGGAVVAKELAERGLRVIVIEEGGYYTVDDFHGPPIARFQKLARDAGTTQTFSRRPIPLPLGKAVGGTTVINSGTCWRAPDKVLRAWASHHGVEGADPSAMQPYFERVERTLNIRPVPRELWGRNAELTHAGITKLGVSGGPLLRNITDCHGCGTCAMGCPSNAKQAMHISYLPLAQRAGARIYARTRVERIVTKLGRAAGLVASILDDNERLRATLTVHAPVVVVSAGTIHTPVVLRRSGLAGRSGQLGRNLRIHPALGVGGAFGEDVSPWRGTLQPYFVDSLFDSHDVMLETTSSVPALAAAALPGIGREATDLLPGMRMIASIGLYVSDTSSGRVYVLPGAREPIIRYHLNQTDLDKLLVGMRLAAEIHLAAGALVALVGLPGLPAIGSTADLDKITGGSWKPEHVRPTAFHPMGTARMGRPEESVIDSWGEHHDVRNLFVADGSIFPTCVGVNPQVSIMAFATRTAKRIAAG
ncbi:MAG TPA: GMC family oxidoreductase [Actinomycetota bacterium]|nr:GMC family oxidoreductase [Actinomycetota bacterium]